MTSLAPLNHQQLACQDIILPELVLEECCTQTWGVLGLTTFVGCLFILVCGFWVCFWILQYVVFVFTLRPHLLSIINILQFEILHFWDIALPRLIEEEWMKGFGFRVYLLLLFACYSCSRILDYVSNSFNVSCLSLPSDVIESFHYQYLAFRETTFP